MKPKVSICCQTYNHGAYIAQTLDGFLMQKTNFDYEILVHEDASTDNTAEVLRAYQKKHPEILKVVYQTENQFLKQNTLVNILFANAEGDYLALCEGDDYWTDENKLQKQVDFLDMHPDYTITGHLVNHQDEEGNIRLGFVRKGEVDFYSFLNGKNFVTLSMLFRNYKGCFEKVIDPYPAGDFFMKAFMLNRGKGYVFEDVMGVYRIHSTGFWSTRTAFDVHQKTILGFRYFLKSFPKRKKEIFKAMIKYKVKYGVFWKTLDRYFYIEIPLYLVLMLKRMTK